MIHQSQDWNENGVSFIFGGGYMGDFNCARQLNA